jgi:NAD(P)-dependent dehydrogenase (short-subunit alcohol dehydrogenase family)
VSSGDLSLAGQAAFVTGGGGGIGRAIALAFADHGADVAVVDLVPERCDEVVAQVEQRGCRAMAFPVNVMDAALLRKAVDDAAEYFGRLDIVVNNAGGSTKRAFAEQSERSWRKHIELNLISALAATSAAIPHIVAGARGGAIINVTSIEGARAAPGYAVYAACKAGLDNLTRTLAVELSDDGIRVNAIAPDYTVTPGTSGNVAGPVDPATWYRPSEAQREVIRRRIPLGRAGIDVECGSLALFLASPMASYITGTIIPVDGGTWGAGGWIRGRDGGWMLPPDPSA